ncbi:proline dehydrogenase family protein [Caldifermentibacillus hisashii]|uniref:proline dehydrogenase family protein n=1 Tax=Caldifermentibacillus hisashii TaxID=996558 RepID=UPI0022B9AF06|nr:proline dehydrogenase family protein [Caldifermentibacillus hisashii]MEC5271743.1 proline dehydrogenase family protein [Caldifermentibacillus hisashii]
MTNLTKNFFYSLSQNKLLNESAKKWGFKFGADKFVAGTDLNSVTKTIKKLNRHGISGTVDNLGEFVSDRQEAMKATNNIIRLLNRINEENLDCHVSVKLTQLGLDIDEQFCIHNMKKIMETASEFGIFVNIDMEDFSRYEQTLRILQTLREEFENVGTVMQAYLYRAEEDLEQLKDVRIRLVKGAYKESEAVAYQSKAEIDRNYLKLAKKRLLGDAFTSIATHDHDIINELKAFIKENNISHDKFEFQMLYGFRTELQYNLAAEGYRFCTYIPFGTDWFGYYMRRLAERPQNINLIVKDVFYDSNNKLKKKPLVIAAGAATFLCLLRKRKNSGK